MAITWQSYNNHDNYENHTTFFDNYMTIRPYDNHDIHKIIIRQSYDNHMTIRWQSHDNKMTITLLSYDNH